MSTDRSHRLRFGPFLVNLHTLELWKHGIRLKLSGQPFEILALLLASPGQLVTREQLRAQLWPSDTFVDFNHGLNAAINKLRDALADSVNSPRHIETLPRRGYRFIAPVETISTPTIYQDSLVGPAFRSGPSSVHVMPHGDGSHAPSIGPDGAPLPSKGAGLESTAIDTAPFSTTPATWSFSAHPYFIAITLAISLFLAATLLLQKVSFTANRHDSFTTIQRIRPLINLSDETGEPAFSPNGSYIAFHRYSSIRQSSGIFVQNIASGELLQLTHNPDDGFPAWSPDSRSIAFKRPGNREASIYIIPSMPTNSVATPTERKLDTGSLIPVRREIAWSPDGHSIVFTTASGLFLVSLENSSPHQLTQSPPDAQDWGASFSPDGTRFLIVRSQQSGFHDEILSIRLSGNCSGGSLDPSGEPASLSSCSIADPTQIASDHANVLGAPQWSVDSRSVIFSSDRGSHPGLWRVSATMRDTPVQINDAGSYPAVSRIGNHLAYQRITRNLNIWEINVTAPVAGPRILIASTSETDQGPGPQISPDGKKAAYMSDRSGAKEIWLADRDGTHPRQLASLGNAGSPRWSPDSQSVVFDVGQRNGPAIYSVSGAGGTPRLLVPSDTNSNVCPSFSADGKWVYFASTRSGNFQVWKVPAEGGSPVQVTYHGGHAALASRDGKFIYYAKSSYANPEIWQISTNGGAEQLVSPLLNPVTWAAWSVTGRGIVFAHPSGQGRPVVSLYDPSTHRLTNLATLPIPPFWLTASPDARSILFDQPGWQQAQIMLVDNFQ